MKSTAGYAEMVHCNEINMQPSTVYVCRQVLRGYRISCACLPMNALCRIAEIGYTITDIRSDCLYWAEKSCRSAFKESTPSPDHHDHRRRRALIVFIREALMVLQGCRSEVPPGPVTLLPATVKCLLAAIIAQPLCRVARRASRKRRDGHAFRKPCRQPFSVTARNYTLS